MSELLRSLGHTVERRDPSYGVPLPLFLPRWLRGIHDDAARLPHRRRLERRIRRLAQAGALFSLDAVARCRAREAGYTARVGQVFEDFDVLMTPTIPELPWPLLRYEGLGPFVATNLVAAVASFTTVWNVTGQPAASVPAGFDDNGLPRAVQLIGRPHDETTLLSLAGQIEAERPWTERRPAVAA